MGLTEARPEEFDVAHHMVAQDVSELSAFIARLEHLNRREGHFSARDLSLAITSLEDARYRLRDYRDTLTREAQRRQGL